MNAWHQDTGTVPCCRSVQAGETKQTLPGPLAPHCGWTSCLGHPHISSGSSLSWTPCFAAARTYQVQGGAGMLPWLLLPRRPYPLHCPSLGHQCRTSLLLFLTRCDTGSQPCWPCVQLPRNGMHSGGVPAARLHWHTTMGDSFHGLSENQAGLSGDH